MKRNDIGDSYFLGCSRGALRRGEYITQEDDYAALCWQALAQPSQVSPVRCTEKLCRQANHWKCPVVMVSIPLPRRHESGLCGVERRPPVQKRSELQAHEATMLRCLAVESGKAREGLPGSCHASSASFLAPHQVSRWSPCVHVNGQLRPLVSQLSCCDLLLRQQAFASAAKPAGSNSLTAASNLNLNCSAKKMTSRNQLKISILRTCFAVRPRPVPRIGPGSL